MICCECKIKSVIPEEGGYRVEFESWRSLSILNDRRLQRGYYFADPSEYDEPASFDDEPPK
jgi:hypothetical protein